MSGSGLKLDAPKRFSGEEQGSNDKEKSIKPKEWVQQFDSFFAWYDTDFKSEEKKVL